MPCFDGMHCVDFSKPESTVGAFVVVVGDFVAAYVRVHHGVGMMRTCNAGGVPVAKGFRDYVSGKMVQGFKDVVFVLEMVEMVKGFRDYVSVVKIDVVHRLFVSFDFVEKWGQIDLKKHQKIALRLMSEEMS